SKYVKADSGDEEVGIGASTYHAYGIGNSTWSFLAVAVSNGIATIYANGEPPYTVNSIPAGPYSLDDLALGQAALGIGPYNGSMANVQIYNSTLSSAQVGSLYLQGIDAIPASRSRLVEWFPLYTNSKDYSGMNNNGTSTGVGYSNIQNYYVNPTGQQMQNFVSKTAFFNGTDSMITLPISVANGSDITMTGWIYLNNVPSTDEGIFSFTSNSNNGTIAVFFKGDCNVEAGVTNTIGAWQGSTGAECLLPDRWYQIAAEANQGSGSYSLYIDGMKQFSAAFTGTLEGSNSIDVGLFSPKSAYFSGLMGNLQFYGTQLSQGELTALYREGLHGGPLNVSELYGFYPLDGNANDYSGNGNNGASYGLNYEPMELPLSTSPIEGVFGCYNTVLCNSTGQRLFVSGLPLENANIGYANMSGSLGMEYGMMPDALHLNGIAYALAHIGSYFGYKNNITASVWAYIAPGYSGPLVAVSGNSGTEALIREQGMKVIGPASNVTLSHPGWYNFIASYSAVNNEAAFYVNGSEIGSPSGITYTAPGQFPYWTTTISSGTLNGTIEDLQIYKSYVSSAQAAQLYMNNSVFGLAPAEYLPLGAGNAGMQNETVNLANYSDYAIMYSAPGFICTNNHFDYGSCGVEYVPG
ncbi:LamG domain-containing protein, partial [Candidatus Marsarchaeota archaeon]|nr:LamG domain-containing protein [Candidatus Marsarchaeota archaeon]